VNFYLKWGGSNVERNRIYKIMKTIIAPEHQESALGEWHGAKAAIWAFHISHKRMGIILDRKGEQEALYIVGIACERISGPFHWDQANITIITETPNQWGEVCRRIVDKQAGFELVCSDVAIARGLGSAPNDPFENIFDDAPKK
jgi:hypothetical protein